MGTHYGYRPSGNAGNIFLDYLYSNFKPKLVYDFSENVYISNYRGQSFTDSVTHAATSPRTMYDSTGTLVWAPHNLFLQSNDLDTTWVVNASAVAPVLSAVDGPDGVGKLWALEDDNASGRGQYTQRINFLPANSSWTWEIWIEKDTDTSRTVGIFANYLDVSGDKFIQINTSTGAFDYVSGGGTPSTAPVSVTQYGELWRVRLQLNTSISTRIDCSICPACGSTSDLTVLDNSVTGSVNAGYVAFYRSDLGGVADNPDQPAGLEKYVPTTSAAVYLPRRNAYYHDGENWVNGGLYHESAASTNLLTNSNTLSSWTATNSSVTQDETGPDDVTSAWTLVDDSGGSSGVVSLQRDVTVSTYTTYTFSVYAKADQLSILALGVADFSFPNDGEIYFDLNNGTVLSAGGAITGRIEKAKNDFYRCSITFTTDTSDTQGTLKMYVVETVGSTDATPIDGTSSIILYGTQFEATEVATSYIPTGSSQATRTAETLTIPAAKIPYSTSNNTVRIQGAFTYDDFDQSPEYTLFRHRADASNNNTLELNTDSSTTGYLEATQTTANESYSVATYDDYVPDTNREYRAAVAYSSSRMSIATDGVLAFSTNNPTELPDLTATDLDLGYDYTGFIKNIVWWDADITDVGLSTVSETDLTPLLYADFVNDYYRDSGGEASFDDIFEHSATGLMTMVDSDGILKWAPHNYLINTHNMASASTYYTGTSLSATATETIAGVPLFTLDEGTDNNQHRVTQGGTPGTGKQIGLSFCYKAGTCRYISLRNISSSQFNPGHIFLVDTQTHTATATDCTGTITRVGTTDMYRVVVYPDSATLSSSVSFYLAMMNAAGSSTVYLGTNRTVLVGGFEMWDATLSRAENPEQTSDALGDLVINSTASPIYLPRRNAYYHNGTAWVNGGLHLESAAATNLIPDSENLLGATWATTATRPTGPDADGWWALAGSASNEGQIFYNGFTFADGSPYVFQLEVKKGTGWLLIKQGPNTVNRFWFDVENGVTGTVDASIDEVRIADFGDRWFVYCVQSSAGSGDSVQVAEVSGDGVLNGSGSPTIYIRRPQLETGSIPTSYIPTNGSTVTRAAETLEVSSALVPSSPTVRMAGKINYTDEGTASQQTFWRRYKDADEFIIVDLDTDSTDTGEVNVNQSNGAAAATVAIDAYESDVDPRISFDIVSSHSTSRTNISASGLLGTADTTSSTLPTFTTENLDVGYDFMGNIEKFAVWNTALVDGKIANITQGSEPFIVGTPSVE